ncbi:MAG: galactokinase family protein, partial [Gemmatimonadales bacterium]
MMRRAASELFRASFGGAPTAAASAPGRVNLIGEHTDYNGGPVLPIATPARTIAVAGPGEPDVLEFVSTRDGRPERLRWTDPLPDRRSGAAYVAGVLRELWALELAPPGGGARVAVASELAVGAGLSSSSALTVACARALAALA